MNLLDFLIPVAQAQATGGAPAAGPMGSLSTFALPIILIAVMYFLMIRPQMKRQKEHKSLLEKLSRGDEVITSGGVAGVISDIGDNFITVEVADNVRIRVQKSAVGHVLPKGTLKCAN
ncbi:preprotein translocase subunit YajC [Xanthomonas hortorum pv. vitians]|uniref:preprotein translocase subunit YajC n=1 Tax=Xanthomonas hortorum TaxID=56454 RepID=UPI0032E8635F